MPADDRTSALEARIDDLQERLGRLQQQLVETRLGQWEGRVDDLEVQMHLGSMDAKDRLTPLVEELRNRWLDARERLSSAPTTASDVVDSLWSGLEKAMDDIRRAVGEARDNVTG